MKKLLSVVLCVLMLAALLPLDLHTASADTSGQCGDNLYWSFDEDTGTLTITGSGDMWNYDSYNDTPWTDDRNDIDIISLPPISSRSQPHTFINRSIITFFSYKR